MYTLPKLPYAHNHLEPTISEEIMKEHHLKHHQKYITALNTHLQKTQYPECEIGKLLKQIKADQTVDPTLRRFLYFNGGSHYNHTLYWHCMSTDEKHSEMLQPLSDQIKKDFKSIDNFKNDFLNSIKNMTGIGWQFLCYDTQIKKLILKTNYQQDNPLLSDSHLLPILACDVWEHAYYLQYKSSRDGFLERWLSIVNWENVSIFFDMAVNEQLVDFMSDGSVDLFERK